ncbi:MAG: alpha/beta fold hydrolase [Myxococcaceae bacterium]
MAVAVLAAALLLVAWFGLSLPPPVPPLAGAFTEGTLALDGGARHFHRYAPPTLADDAPIVLVLHGTGEDGLRIRRDTAYELDAFADRLGFSVLYPDGLSRQWNDCRPKSSPTADVDDVGFLLALVDQEHRPGAPLFVFGFSNGGQMALRLAVEHPERVRAAAVTGANLPTPDFFRCTSTSAPAPLLFANGTADPIVPFAGGHVTIFHVIDRGYAYSADETARRFAERLDAGTPVVDEPAPHVTRRRWSSPERPLVEQLIFEGGGHVVAQPHWRFPRLLGPTPTFDLPAEVIAFFGLATDGGTP